jgi:2,3,4,5-tetrahydropyridine-2-carboxylate N-succinyltransferase
MTRVVSHIRQIEEIWSNTEAFLQDQNKKAAVIALLDEILQLLNSGQYRVCEKVNDSKEGDDWQVNDWLKKAILLLFKFLDAKISSNGAAVAFDKIPLRFNAQVTAEDFMSISIRVCAGAIIRNGVFLGREAVIMPSFINLGAHIGQATMIDSMTTIGSCAQIGANCHISSGVTIAGVLEPLAQRPVIIEDDCFIGAGSQISEGMLIGRGSVISSGVTLCSSTKIYDRELQNVTYNKIPPYSVVVPGMMQTQGPAPLCAIIVKKVDAKTRSKTSINEILR